MSKVQTNQQPGVACPTRSFLISSSSLARRRPRGRLTLAVGGHRRRARSDNVRGRAGRGTSPRHVMSSATGHTYASCSAAGGARAVGGRRRPPAPEGGGGPGGRLPDLLVRRPHACPAGARRLGADGDGRAGGRRSRRPPVGSAAGPRARDVTCRRQIRGRSRASGSRASSWRGPHRDSSGCDEKLSLCDHASEQPLAGGGRPNPSVVLCNDGATAACGPSKIQQCWQLARHAPAGGLELARQRTRDAQARARDVEVPAAAQRSRNGGMGGGGEEGCDSGGIFDLFTRTLCAD
jgi:hypothetical protein